MLNFASGNCYIAGTKVLPRRAEIIGKEDRQSEQRRLLGGVEGEAGERKRQRDQRLREQLQVLTSFHACAHQVQKHFL